MPARKREPGLYYVNRKGTEVDLSASGFRFALGSLETRLLQAHLLHAMSQVQEVLKLAASGKVSDAEPPLPLLGDPSTEGSLDQGEVD